MQKVTAFLEQYVQWVAICLGALFCLFMIYSYVLTPPAEVSIDGKTLGPSEVDPNTADTVAAKLQSAIQSSGRIKMEVPQYVQSFQDTMTWKNAKPVAFSVIDSSLKDDVQLPTQQPTPGPGGANGAIASAVGAGGTGTGTVESPAIKIKLLPVLPKPKYDGADGGLKYGRSVIIPPPAPGQPAPPTPAPGQIPQGAIDKDWVTQMWKVSMPELDKAWRDAGFNNPALAQGGLDKTVFLNVEMVREELVNGQWTNSTIIPPIDGINRDNQPRPAYPPSGMENRGLQFNYITWAATHTPDVIQPIFYPTVPGKGDQWTKPGQQVTGQIAFDPATFKGNLADLPPDQKAAVLQYRQLKHKQDMEQKKSNRPAPRAPGGRGTNGPPEIEGANFAPRRDLPHYAPAPPGAIPAAGRVPPGVPPYVGRNQYVGAPDMDGGEGGFGAGAGYGGPQPQNLPQPGTDYPAGEFNPSAPPQGAAPQPWQTKDVEVWAHDVTAQPGHKYRYKMRYMLKNPIFGAGNIAEPQALANEFAIASDFSEWTTPIEVPSMVNFFVAGGGLGDVKTMRFEIFRWDQGMQKADTFDVGPGDPVGWSKNGIDFGTEWTVVDIRKASRDDWQVLLLNNTDGKIVARSSATDRSDRLYQALKKQVSDAKAADAAASAGATPGGVAAGR